MIFACLWPACVCQGLGSAYDILLAFTTLDKEEIDSLHVFELLMQDLKHEIEVATEESNATKLPAKADAEGDLADASGNHDADVT